MNRSWIFVPGNADKHLNKSFDLQVDNIIFDLEDSIPNEEKQVARQKIKERLQLMSNKKYFVRVNMVYSDFFLQDLYEIMDKNLFGFVIPKVQHEQEIVISDYLLEQYEKIKGFEAGTFKIIPIIETAQGVENINNILQSSKRVMCAAFGSEDLKLDTSIETDEKETELLYARSKLVSASRAAAVEPPIDAIYTEINNDEKFEKSVVRAKRLGFQGKLLIHPSQIDITNHFFQFSKQEIEEAKQIVKVYESSSNEGRGAIQLNGKMIDVPVAERAKRILEEYHS